MNFDWDYRPETYLTGDGRFQGDQSFQRVSPAIGPAGLVGEYLPKLRKNEIEIVMIGARSTLGDVTSVRARHRKNDIGIFIVDESEEEGSSYEYSPKQCKAPLSMREITDLLWSIVSPGWGPIFAETWKNDPKDTDFWYLRSDFYPGLDEWLDYKHAEFTKELPEG